MIKKNKHSKNLKKFQRARGKLKISFLNSDEETSICDLHQSGSLKVLIPKSKSKYADAVLINTGGGTAGGDYLSVEVNAFKETKTWVTTQASEKVYRSNGELSHLRSSINLSDDSTLFWFSSSASLEQEYEIEIAVIRNNSFFISFID